MRTLSLGYCGFNLESLDAVLAPDHHFPSFFFTHNSNLLPSIIPGLFTLKRATLGACPTGELRAPKLEYWGNGILE